MHATVRAAVQRRNARKREGKMSGLDEEFVIPSYFFIDKNYVLQSYSFAYPPFRPTTTTAATAITPETAVDSSASSSPATLPITDDEAKRETFTVEAFSLKASKTDFDLTGQILWPGTEILSAFLVSPRGRQLVTNRTCIELGSGAGVCGILAGKWAEHVVVTDHNDVVLELLHKNCEHAQLSTRLGDHRAEFTVARMDWGAVPIPPSAWFNECTVILGSDIVYSATAVNDLFTTVKYLLQNAGSTAKDRSKPNVFILSYLLRWGTVDKALNEGFGAFGLHVEDVPLSSFMHVADHLRTGRLNAHLFTIKNATGYY